MLFIPVEFIRRDYYNQIITESLCSAKKIDVTVVKKIKGSVCNNSFSQLLYLSFMTYFFL